MVLFSHLFLSALLTHYLRTHPAVLANENSENATSISLIVQEKCAQLFVLKVQQRDKRKEKNTSSKRYS